MKKYIIDENNELYHHGIKGQKWGIRRYQNEDGSYTRLGKSRRNAQHIKKNELGYFENHKGKFQDYNKDVVFEKGNTFERLSTESKETNDKRKYLTQLPNIYYEKLTEQYGKELYVNVYKNKKDILLAGYDSVNEALKNIGEKPLPTVHNYLNREDRLFFEKDDEKSKALSRELINMGYDGLIDTNDPFYGINNSAFIILDKKVNDTLEKIGSYPASYYIGEMMFAPQEHTSSKLNNVYYMDSPKSIKENPKPFNEIKKNIREYLKQYGKEL